MGSRRMLDRIDNVMTAKTSTPAPAFSQASPFDVLRARRLVEGEAAALAARNATPAQIKAIQAAFTRLAAELRTSRIMSPADREFHLRIAEATGNGALVAVVKMLWDERRGPLFKRLEHHYDTPGLWTAAMAEHRLVLKAIAEHDVAGARAAMQRHLNRAYKRFTKGWKTLH